MRSLTAAATLLAAANDPATLATLLGELGFPTPPSELTLQACEQLGLPPTVVARVARGDGALRALILVTAGTPLRDVLATVAPQLARRTPELLWLIVAVERDGPGIAIATWTVRLSDPLAPPRVVALVASREHVVESDAETLCAIAAVTRTPGGDVMRHTRWTEVLGREAVTRRFFGALERAIDTMADTLVTSPRLASTAATIPPDDARHLALLYVTRLLFLAFLETKGWLNEDFGFLINGFADCMAHGGQYQRRVLEPLFFGTLNTRPTARATRAHAFGKIPFLNGGLFARSALERRWRQCAFTDEAIGALYEHVLTRYRFTAREDTLVWSEAAIDPEILGKAFESLMATRERKRSGAYYTPQALVERVTRHALQSALHTGDIPADVVEAALSGDPVSTRMRGLLLDRTSGIRILDPACGSGAFLVHALEELSTLRARLGDPRPLSAIRRAVLTSAIYGVDVNPTAVWLCELRLWLSVMIESAERDPLRVLPLPNLDHQIRVGDTLAGGTFDGQAHATLRHNTGRSVVALRQRYARTHGPRKKVLARLLERAERTRAIAQIDQRLEQLATQRRELVCRLRGRDLFAQRDLPIAERSKLQALKARIRRVQAQRQAILDGAALPFGFSTHFPDVADAGGFDVILGNPPWVRLHNIDPAARAGFRETFRTFRNAAWTAGATQARAGAGFAAQVDLAALFVERSTELVAHNGTIALLLPGKLWRSLAGGGTRTLVRERLRLVALEDLSDAGTGDTTFDAAVYPSIFIARRTDDEAIPPVAFAIQRATHAYHWCAPFNTLPLDATRGAPWLLVPPEVRSAFDTLCRKGIPLSRTPLGRPYLGVKSGCNEAFIVRETGGDERLATVTGNASEGQVERTLLRPLLRGETVQPWRTAIANERIVWTHDVNGKPYRTLPLHARRWLSQWEYRLSSRSDVQRYHRQGTWWMLFRTDSADARNARVVWSDFGRTPRAVVLPPGDCTVPLNTCYVVRCETIEDADAFATLLNAPLIAAWLHILAEPARGGYRRYFGWTMALLPLPRDWQRARAILAPLGAQAREGKHPTVTTLHEAVLRAYQLRPATMVPLLDWCAGDDRNDDSPEHA